MKSSPHKYYFHPLFIALVLSLIVHTINIFQYDIFPEKDSYGWILQYEDAFAAHSFELYRPLFASLVYFLHTLSGLTVGQIFKYVLPFFSVVVLFPLWLMAINLRTRRWQVLFLCFSLVSPTVIFQMESMRPQIMVVYFLYFLIGITYFFRFQPSILFDFVLGSLLLLGIFFHSGFGILFLLWVISMALLHWRWCWQRKQQSLFGIAMFLLGVFLLFRFAQISGYLNFIPELIKNLIVSLFSLNINFLYPTAYINSDGVPMGWPGLMGIIKFYGFYVGPLIFFGIASFLFLFFRNTLARLFFLEQFREKRFLFIFLSIGIFIVVTEIFPRFFNIALLPDRVWAFLAILLLLPLFFLVVFIEKETLPRWQGHALFLVFSFFFCMNVIGTGYVSNQFQYLSSPDEMQAFHWIREHLPYDRILLHFSYGDLLSYHSNSKVYKLPKDFLQGLGSDHSLEKLFSCQVKNDIRQDIHLMNDASTRLSTRLNHEESQYIFSNSMLGTALRAKASRLIDESVALKETVDTLDALCQQPLYIYVSYSHEKNPFRERAYDTGFSFETEHETVAVLNRYPEIFKLIFQNERVFIWKIVGGIH